MYLLPYRRAERGARELEIRRRGRGREEGGWRCGAPEPSRARRPPRPSRPPCSSPAGERAREGLRPPPPRIEGGGGSRAVPRLRYTTNRASAPRRGRHGRRGREQGGGRGIQRDEGGGPPHPRRRPDPVAARRTCRACRCLARCRRGRPEERRRRPGESEGRREREWSATGWGEWVDKK